MPTVTTKAPDRTPLDPGDGALELADHRMAATTPLMWIMLLALCAVLAAAVVWSVFGRAPTVVSGRGIILPPDGTYEIGVPYEGTVETLLIDVGSPVAEGDVVAVIRGPDGVPHEVRSVVAGTVTQMFVKRGTYDRNGAALALVEPSTDNLGVVAYVDAASGKDIEPGMRVYVQPSSAPAAQYGTMVGRVVAVSSAPVDSARIELMVGRNAALVQRLTGSGAVDEVMIDIEDAPQNASGFRWSSGRGPDYEITSGTLASVEIITSDRAPIRRLLG